MITTINANLLKALGADGFAFCQVPPTRSQMPPHQVQATVVNLFSELWTVKDLLRRRHHSDENNGLLSLKLAPWSKLYHCMYMYLGLSLFWKETRNSVTSFPPQSAETNQHVISNNEYDEVMWWQPLFRACPRCHKTLDQGVSNPPAHRLTGFSRQIHD